jgi:hypothetical protein
MPRRKTKLNKNDSNNSLISEKVSVYGISKDELLSEETETVKENTVEELLKQDPIYDKDTDVNDMIKRNKDFYEKTSKKVFKTLLEEEQTRLNKLISATYYPEKKEEEPDNLTLVKDHLNLIP